VAGPLLLLGTPEWLARPLVERLRLAGVLRIAARPLVAGVAFNVILIATHAPFTVDTFRANQFGSFTLDMLWIASGLLLWFPLISPLPEYVHPSPAVRCVYLFLASGALPMVPGGIMTFSSFPLYATYELAPRVHGISAAADQQSAGILMKIGNIPVVWGYIFATFVKWAMSDRRSSPATRPAARVDPGAGPQAATATATDTAGAGGRPAAR
jgi:putative membrane protein